MTLKKIYMFRDHFKKSTDFLRDIFGVYFNFTNGQITDNEKTQFFSTSDFSFSPSQLIDAETLLYRQKVVIKVGNSDFNNQHIQSFYNPTHDPAEQDYFIGTVDSVLNETIKDSESLYRDINFAVAKSDPQSDLYNSIIGKYNFFIESYEKFISKDTIPEEVLPNFYVFNLALDRSTLSSLSQADYNSSLATGNDSPYDQFLSRFDQFITLDGNISLLQQGNVNLFFGLYLVAYCEKYAEVYDNVNINFIETMKKRFGRIFNDMSNQEMLNQLNQFKTAYPMYIELAFKTPTNSPFLQFLQNAGIQLESFTQFVNDQIIIEKQSQSPVETGLGSIFAGQEPFDWVETNPDGSAVVDRDLFYLNDAGGWINQYLQAILDGAPAPIVSDTDEAQDENPTNPSTGFAFAQADFAGFSANPDRQDLPRIPNGITFLNPNGTSQIKPDDQFVQGIRNMLLAATAKPKYNDLIKDSIRSYKDIIQGNLAKSDILYYRIEKRDNKNNLIQIFYIINIPGVDVQSFVDTQIKYNKDYVYKIFAANIVYGTEYYYKQEQLKVSPTILGGIFANGNPIINDDDEESESIPMVPNAGSGISIGESEKKEEFGEFTTSFYSHTYTFDVYYQPSVYLIETEYSDDMTARVVDSPPTPPHVEFWPIRDCKSRFWISLSPSSGEIRDYPKFIERADNWPFFLALSQQNSPDGKLTFRFDENITHYESLRIEEPPTKYADFATSKTSKRVHYNSVENLAFIEHIEPNIDYYYTFRCFDHHSHRSNPSPIFKIKIVYNDGISFLTIEEFTFKTTEHQFEKSFKRFVKIRPNLLQTTYSFLDEKLGLVKESVFDQKFLVRVTSKHTGKAMDIVIRFNKEDKI